ncbi:MAG: hypothetical protein E6I27_04220 [Chloroflexi bacterium]|nr:MAG: hypothetical protein E6I96_10305 [Chloroflexota bacterium]TMF38858.1 MAG: hypothetical protein E6I27_04220 [Chloroflexota bacterium]
MPRTSIPILLAVLMLAACGGASPTSQGPTVSRVAVQKGDLPAGMVKCDLTGDIANFIKSEQTPDPNTAQSMTKEWDAAKSKGAKGGYAAIYTDSAAHCAAIKSNSADIGAATYKLVVNFVIQFRDEKSAAAGYNNESILGFSASQLKAGGGAAVQEGTKTGLTANSITLIEPIGNQFFYIAVWQNKSFMVILAAVNLDSGAAKNVASSENSRIK